MGEPLVKYLTEKIGDYIPDGCHEYLVHNYKWAVGEKFLINAQSRLPKGYGGQKLLNEIQERLHGKASVAGKTVTLDIDLTFRLRDVFANYFVENKNNLNKDHIEFIVSDWGGIEIKDCNKFIEKYLSGFPDQNVKIKYERISSSTKVLSFYQPKEHAIYDSRVIYSLNWLILRIRLENPSLPIFKFFPQPSSENGVLKRLNYSSLLTATFNGSHEILTGDIGRVRASGGKMQFNSLIALEIECDKNQAYEKYSSLLLELSSQLLPKDDHALTKVEMLLFAMADKEIAQDVVLNASVMYQKMVRNHG